MGTGGTQRLAKNCHRQHNEELANVINGIKAAGEFPQQLAIAYIAMFPKEIGERPIAQLPLMYAWLVKTLWENTLRWDKQLEDFWDTAINGSSALQAALTRRLLDELSITSGQVTGAVYWDLD